MLFVLVKSSQFHEERVKQVFKYNGPKKENPPQTLPKH